MNESGNFFAINNFFAYKVLDTIFFLCYYIGIRKRQTLKGLAMTTYGADTVLRKVSHNGQELVAFKKYNMFYVDKVLSSDLDKFKVRSFLGKIHDSLVLIVSAFGIIVGATFGTLNIVSWNWNSTVSFLSFMVILLSVAVFAIEAISRRTGDSFMKNNLKGDDTYFETAEHAIIYDDYEFNHVFMNVSDSDFVEAVDTVYRMKKIQRELDNMLTVRARNGYSGEFLNRAADTRIKAAEICLEELDDKWNEILNRANSYDDEMELFQNISAMDKLLAS